MNESFSGLRRQGTTCYRISLIKPLCVIPNTHARCAAHEAVEGRPSDQAPELMQLIHSVHTGADPNLPTTCLGKVRSRINGRAIQTQNHALADHATTFSSNEQQDSAGFLQFLWRYFCAELENPFRVYTTRPRAAPAASKRLSA